MAAVVVFGQTLAPDADHFFPERRAHLEDDPDATPLDMDELARLRALSGLRVVSIYDMPLDDRGLAHLCDCPGVDNLALQNTQISDAGLRHLARLTQLRHLRLKDNRQLTDACAPHLAAVRSLEDLQLHETSVGPAGLAELAALPNLRHLLVPLRSLERHADADRAKVYADLLALSKRMPRCELLAKGRGTFTDGVFQGSWPD